MGASGFSGQSTIDSPDCWYLREKECYVVFFFGRGGGGEYEILFGWIGTAGRWLCSWICQARIDWNITSGKTEFILCESEFLWLLLKFTFTLWVL